MGLGPTICCRCQVFAWRDENNNDCCFVCDQDDDLEYLWLFTEEQQKKIHDNTRFYRFVAGEDATQTDG